MMISEKVMKSFRRRVGITLAIGMFLVVGGTSIWIKGPDLFKSDTVFFAVTLLVAAALVLGMMLVNRGESWFRTFDKIERGE